VTCRVSSKEVGVTMMRMITTLMMTISSLSSAANVWPVSVYALVIDGLRHAFDVCRFRTLSYLM
jgi:hypothetical protein